MELKLVREEKWEASPNRRYRDADNFKVEILNKAEKTIRFNILIEKNQPQAWRCFKFYSFLTQ